MAKNGKPLNGIPWLIVDFRGCIECLWLIGHRELIDQHIPWLIANVCGWLATGSWLIMRKLRNIYIYGKLPSVSEGISISWLFCTPRGQFLNTTWLNSEHFHTKTYQTQHQLFWQPTTRTARPWVGSTFGDVLEDESSHSSPAGMRHGNLPRAALGRGSRDWKGPYNSQKNRTP